MDEKLTQFIKPHGEEGIETIEQMNTHHEDVSEYAMECIQVNENDDVLDIGCGGGVNIEKFLKRCPAGRVDGLDHSELSVEYSINKNQKAVDEGRCQVIQADVMDMPIDDETYDVISAFETVYFWPDLNVAFMEVRRILKSDGQFMIALETDGTRPEDKQHLRVVEGMRVYTKEQLEEYLFNAGFREVTSYKKEDDYILVVIARK